MRSARCQGICCPTCWIFLCFLKAAACSSIQWQGCVQVLDTFNTCFGNLRRFRLIYNSPRSWSSRKDKSITRLQSVTKFLRHCTQIGYLQRTKESTPLPPPLHWKVGCLLFFIGSSTSGTTLHGGDGGTWKTYFPLVKSVKRQKSPSERSVPTNFVADCSYH